MCVVLWPMGMTGCLGILCCLHTDIIMRVTVLIALLYFLSAVVDVCSQTAPYVSFMGTNLPNHSYIDFTQVGEGSDSVQCHTDLITCCSKAQGPDRGDWYHPNGERLQFYIAAGNRLYESRVAQRVDLSVRGTPTPPEGIYLCDIETSATNNDSRESAYVGLYWHNNRGQYTCMISYVYTSFCNPYIPFYNLQIISSGAWFQQRSRH